MSSISFSSPLNTLSALGSGPLTANGLATGLNTNQLIQGLLSLQQASIQNLQNEQKTLTTQQSAFQAIAAKLQALQSSLSPLTDTSNGAFNARQVTSSNPNLVTAAASASATPGVYSLRVNNLATAAQVASQGFDSATSALTHGTLQIAVGGATTTITVDSSNDTLSGLARAINNADLGVTASVINDGRSHPYRLLLTGTQTGSANGIAITNDLAADSGSARQPNFNTGEIGAVQLGANFTGTATPTANADSGAYTGAANDTYTFTVLNGGTVGADNGVQVGYTNRSGTQTGTITLDSGDAGVLQNVANGVHVQFAAGTLIAGQQFSIDTSVPNVEAAADASVTIGSGPGALTVTSANNQLEDVIPGVTIALQGADANQAVQLTVSSDPSKAATAIQNFVSAYNDLATTIGAVDSYDAQTQTAGPLLGNGQLLNLQSHVRNILLSGVPGSAAGANYLGALGITFDSQGQLQLNQSKLNNALQGGIRGVRLSDLQRLFGLAGSSTNPLIQFVSGSANTVASAAPYQVNVTAAATQASVTAANALAATTTIDGSNNTFGIKIDGVDSGALTIANGSYSRLAVAQALQAQINQKLAPSGRQVTVQLAGNNLQISSNSYGSISRVSIDAGGTALATLGFAGSESAQGQDVAGNFVVNGVVESAVGRGQFLEGASGNANTADLQVQVTATPAQVQAGLTGTVTVSRGIASQLDAALTGMVTPVTGQLAGINNGLQKSIDALQKSIDLQNQLYQTQQQQLIKEFANLETTVSRLRNASTFLTTQLNSTLALTSSSSRSTGNSIL